jgi:hypothetical protein
MDASILQAPASREDDDRACGGTVAAPHACTLNRLPPSADRKGGDAFDE